MASAWCAGPLWLAGCSGDFAYRSTAELSGSIALPEGIRKVRFEIDNGTVGMDVTEANEIRYAGGARRAGNSPEALAEVEAIELEMVGVVDSGDPATLVVRGPAAPPGQTAVLALELGIRLPAHLEVELTITHNGHITAANRKGALTAGTGRGDLRFEHCRGATARTGRGNVIAFDHRGDLDLITGIGDMQVFVREPGEQIRLDTGQGTVQCYIPPTAGFRVDARAEVGRCGSSFGLDVDNPSAYSAVMTGTRGDGHTGIVLRTGKGYLTLGSKTFH